MLKMKEEERMAYEWAKNQAFNSVSARNARTLAAYISRNEEHELDLEAAHRRNMERD